MYKSFRFEKLLCDNGREFANYRLKEFCKKRGIEIDYSIPYHHESNGRVERVIRTIGEAIKKEKQLVRFILKKVIDNYNESIHRGIGMTPNEALLEENHEQVMKRQEEYNKEYEKYNKKEEVFEVGDRVLLKNEHKKNKMDFEYKDQGVFTAKLYKNVYEIESENGVKSKRHAKQL